MFRDDRLDRGELCAADLPGDVDVEAMDAPIAADSAVIVAAADDGAIVARLGVRPMVRWCAVQGTLARALEKELRSDSIDMRLGRRTRELAGRADRLSAS